MKPLMVSYNPRYGKTYYKYPVIFRKGRQQVIDRVSFGLASSKLLTEYERKKTDYTENLNEDVLESLERSAERKKASKEVFNPGEYVDKILADKNRFLKTYNKRTSVDLHKVKAVFKLPTGKARQVKALVEEKI
jgi:hypothetical protein